MSGRDDCKVIEKNLKDIIFGMNSSGHPSTEESNLNYKLSTIPFSVDNPFSSFKEKNTLFNQNTIVEPFPKSSTADSLTNDSNCSKLIDLNALTEFTAKHIDDSSFKTPNKDRKLPHPDLEDDMHTISSNPDVSVLFEEIQKSPNFCNLPENPLHHSISKSSKSPSRDRDSESNHSPTRKSSSKKRKKKKNNKQKDSSIIEKSKDEHKTQMKALEQEGKEETTYIKTKKKVFSSIGREYSLHLEKEVYRFQCHICNFSTDLKSNVNKHLTSKPHLKQKELSDKDMMLPFLPEPLSSQVEAITELIIKEAGRKGLNKKDLEVRKALSQKFSEFVHQKVPICSVHLIGSSAYGIGLKQSEVDFVVKVSDDELVPDALEALYNAINKEAAYEKAVADFQQKRPRVCFIDKETKLFCNILIDNSSSLKLANILATYWQLDDRVLILGGAVRYWAKLCDLDLQDCGTLPPFSYALLLVHFLQQVQPPVLPVLHEVKNFSGGTEFYEKYIKDKDWKSENTDSVGELWLKFLKFYIFEYKIGESVVCIRTSKKGTCSERNWNTKFYAIEEPFLRRNIAYVIPTFQICQFIQNCFLRTYRYFAYPQLSKNVDTIQLLKTDDFDALKLSEYVKEPILKGESDESEISDNEDSTVADLSNISQDLEDHDPDIALEDLVSTVANLTLDQEISDEKAKDEENSLKHTEKSLQENQKSPLKFNNEAPICYWDINGKVISKEMFYYILDSSILKGDKGIPTICRLCKKSGHLKKDCPVEEIQPPLPLPPMTMEYLDSINHVLLYIWEKNRVSDDHLKEIESNMKDIEASIKVVFPDAKLSLFGSFCNGFGFRNSSDMDFCLTFTEQNNGKDLDSTEIIKKVAAQLLKHPRLENVISITSAKVPIVKFSWKGTGVEGDISLYNTLALINTQMLEAYSKIDQRVQILGYALKYFAKTLGICDASRGSLSSYAYILMVLYFLQQTTPPVIPVLQELYDGEKPVELVDDWNVWFYKDINKLKDVWPEFGKNKKPVGQLWLELLCFYACDFNWKEYVIAIKQKSPLRRFKKLWISDELAIEDPFDLNHNLGGGLSKKMNVYILKALIRGRERFGTPIPYDRMFTLTGKEVVYFFNKSFLNSGRDPPHDRGCGNCGKIGHKRKDCPQEKTCSYCRKPGHLIRNCPRKRNQPQDQRNMQKGNQYNNFGSPNNERRRSAEKIHNQRMLPQHPMMKNELLMRTYPGMQIQNSPVLDSQKLIQMGVPMHRMPPPGFSARTLSNPPPGFNSNVPLMQKPANYSSPFPHIPPFPSQGSKKEILSQSPPKHYAASPPKNYQPGKPFHKQPSAGWPMNPRNAGYPVERHPNPNHMRGNSRGNWTDVPQPVQHKSNQHQTNDHRHNRTNSDRRSYNSNPDKWFNR